jgi:hypothetical protein
MARKPKENEPTLAQPATINLSANEAAEIVQGAVNGMRQQWLQAAVTLSNALKNGQGVGLGSIEDLRRLRENYEELERARLVLQNIRAPASPETIATSSDGGADEDTPVI